MVNKNGPHDEKVSKICTSLTPSLFSEIGQATMIGTTKTVELAPAPNTVELAPAPKTVELAPAP